ncbi:MAG: hypothetical protein DWI68_04230 [Chloroflexi bacterium]|nr:MAG: hypothetical protein DWI68_04230 [Chloroflexota bacterium]
MISTTPYIDGRACNHCGFGVLRAYSAAHAGWHGNHFVVVPNLPAWKCHYCGFVEHDLETMNRVATVLGSSAELAHQHLRRVQRQRLQAAQRRPKASTGAR